jgi:hypothetical protein
VRYGLDVLADEPTTLALRLAHRPDTLETFVAGYEEADGTAMKGFTLASRRGRPPAALTARRCDSSVSGRGRNLELDLRHGRFLRLDAGGAPVTDLAFERLELRLDLARLTDRPKQEIIDLRCYTGEELGLLDRQWRRLLRSGWPVDERSSRRVPCVEAVRALRVQAALLPLLCVILVVGVLGRPGGSGWVRTGAVVATGIALFFEESVLGIAVYRRNVPLASALAFLPTLHTALTLGVVEVASRRRGRGSRGP